MNRGSQAKPEFAELRLVASMRPRFMNRGSGIRHFRSVPVLEKLQ